MARIERAALGSARQDADLVRWLPGLSGASRGRAHGSLCWLALTTTDRGLGYQRCVLTVRSDGRPLTIASSDGYANMLDKLQYRLDQGPCLSTLQTGEVVLDDGTDAGERWPLYRMQGEAAGLGVSLSVPISHGAQVLAALNLYSRTPRSFTPAERARARGFADRAGGGVAIALKLARRTELTDDLQAALAGRAVIDQALGIIMGQRRCSADEAFGVLREVSQTGNIKLREVAARLITVTTGQPPRTEPPLQQAPPTE